MEADSSDILGQKTMPVARGSNSQRSSFSTTKLAFYGVALLVTYAVGQRLWKRFLLWRERSYKLATRRRHGIPDDDLRPFNVAYTEAVMRSREEETRKQANARPAVRSQVASIDLGEAMPNQNLRQRSAAHNNDGSSRATAVPVPGGYSSRYNNVLAPPSRSAHDLHANGSTYAPSTSSGRRLSRHSARLDLGEATSDYEAKKRGWDVDEDEEHEAKKTRVEGEELIDGDEDAEFDEAAPKRGSKRGIRDDEEIDEGKVSSKSRGKRARKVSTVNGRHGYQADHSMDVDDDDEEMDDITELKTISRGKKRDRAEAGSTFGGDDDDSGAEHDENDSKLRRRRRKRRTVAKRKSEVTHLRNKKRQRDVDEDLSDDSEGSSPSKVSSKTRKRGKRFSYSGPREYERQRSDVSMDESLASSRSRPREIGEEWESNEVKWKIGLNGQKLRLTLVKKARQRFVMPKDSQHPDREANMQICVETWLTEDEYQQAKANHALAWQDSPKHGEKLSVDTSQNGVPFPQQVPGKNLLWSTSATSTPTMSPASHSSEGTPEVYQPRVSHSSYRHSLGGSTGLPGSPFGNSGMPTVKRISSTSRALSMSSSLHGPFGSSVNGHDSPIPGLSDSTNASPRSPAPKVFSKWEKQELEAKAIMKVREANKKKEMEREAKAKAERDAKEKVEQEKAAAAEKARLEKERVEKERQDREKAEKERKDKEAAAAKASASTTAPPNITITPPTLTGTGGGAIPNTFFNPTKPAETTPTPAAAPSGPPSSVPNFFSKTAEPAKPAVGSPFSFGPTAAAAPTPTAAPSTSSPFSFPAPASTTAAATEKNDTTPGTAASSGTGLFGRMGPPTQPAQTAEQPKANPLFSFGKQGATSTTTTSTSATTPATNPVKFGFPSASSTPSTAATGASSLNGAFGGGSDQKATTNGVTPPLFNFKAPTSSASGTSTPSTLFGTSFSAAPAVNPSTNGAKDTPKPAGTTASAFGNMAKATPFGQGAAGTTTSAFGNTGATNSVFGKTSTPSAFGAASSTPSPFGGASSSTTAPSAFGASSTPNPFAAAASNATKPEAKPTFSFGGTPSTTATTAPTTSTFAFGAPKATTPAATPAASGTTFKFGPPTGSSTTASASPPFGAPASTTGSSLFGNSAANAATTPTTTTPAPLFNFGTPAQK